MALKAGDKPFGSILVNSEGNIIAEARNQVNTKNILSHPEIELALWAAENLSQSERKSSIMYTTGEHCPMCSSAHGWVGLGTIVYLSSGDQLKEWLEEFKAPKSPIQFYPVEEVISNIAVRGPAKGELLERIKELHKSYYSTKE